MKNKPMDMVVNFNSLDEIMAWIDYAKSMRFQPKTVQISLSDVVFGAPCEPNAAIDEMVAKAEAAIASQLTGDDMRKLFGETAAKRGAEFVRNTMGKHGGTRLADIAESAWPALAEELRNA